MSWLLATLLTLSCISGVFSWAFFRLCSENAYPDAENYAKWHSYFGWSSFFQGTGLAFLSTSIALFIVEIL